MGLPPKLLRAGRDRHGADLRRAHERHGVRHRGAARQPRGGGRRPARARAGRRHDRARRAGAAAAADGVRRRAGAAAAKRGGRRCRPCRAAATRVCTSSTSARPIAARISISSSAAGATRYRPSRIDRFATCRPPLLSPPISNRSCQPVGGLSQGGCEEIGEGIFPPELPGRRCVRAAGNAFASSPKSASRSAVLFSRGLIAAKQQVVPRESYSGDSESDCRGRVGTADARQLHHAGVRAGAGGHHLHRSRRHLAGVAARFAAISG